MSNYARANTTAHWYQDKWPGATMKPNCGVLHTTETASGVPDYAGGSEAPTYTAVPNFAAKRLDWFAHFPDEKSARALVNAPGGVDTNTANCVQVELVGTCAPGTHDGWTKAGIQHVYWPEAPDWAIADLAAFVADQNKRHGTKIVSGLTWKPYPASYGANGVRMTFAAWRAFYGWCGHQHVPENDHGDPGAFPWAKLEAAAKAIVNPAPAPTPAPAVKVRHRFVGTMNERDAVDPTHPNLIPVDRVQADAEKFANLISLGGIQEWPANRDSILNSLTAFDSTRNPEHKTPGPPILWRRERFTLCAADAPVGAKGRNVGKLPGRKSVLGDYRYTRVILTDTAATGPQKRDVAVFNVHFPAHWQLWPGKRRQMAREYEAAVAADVKAHTAAYDVYVVGDTNWGYLQRAVSKIAPQKVMNRAGLTACWYGHTPRPTLGRRTVDMIWHQSKATYQPETLKTGSDHAAVIATY